MFWIILACSDVEKINQEIHDVEMLTTVQLDITDEQGGLQTLRWSDPEMSGEPIIDDIVLENQMLYSVSISFWDDYQDPAENLNAEIMDEATEHQIFFGGTIVNLDENGLLEQSYLDQDANGNPLGLENTWQTLVSGSGELIIGLRHIPDEDGVAMKTGDLEESWLESGEETLPGDWDALVSFSLMVE